MGSLIPRVLVLPACTALAVLVAGCGGPAESPPQRPAAAEQATAPATTPARSTGISREEDAQIPSGPPGTVHVSHRDGVHVVEWKGTRDDTIAGYEVYRKCLPGEWERLGFVELRPDDERNRGTYVFQDEFSVRCEYTVAAVGADGKPGPKSVEIQ